MIKVNISFLVSMKKRVLKVELNEKVLSEVKDSVF